MQIITFLYDKIKWTTNINFYIDKFLESVNKFKDSEDESVLITDNRMLNYSFDRVEYLPEFIKKWKSKKHSCNLKRMYAFSNLINLKEEIFIVDLDMIIQNKLNPIKTLEKNKLFTNADVTGLNPGGGIYYTKTRSKYKYLWDNILIDFKSALILSKDGQDRKWIKHQVKDIQFLQDVLPKYCGAFKRIDNPYEYNILWFPGNPKPYE